MLVEILSLLLSVLAIAVVLYICYRASKFMAGKVNSITSSANVKILERALLGQDKGLAVAEVCGRFYLIGFSSSNIEILKELEEYKPKEQQKHPVDFLSVLKNSMKSPGADKTGEKTKND